MRKLLTNTMVAISALIIVSWAVVGAMLWQAHVDAIRTAVAAGQHMARVLSEYEASSLRAVDLTLRYLRDDWLRDPASLDRSVERHQEHLQREGLLQVAVVDADGWSLYSHLPMAKRMNFADRDYFQTQKASKRDEMVISEPVMGRV